MKVINIPNVNAKNQVKNEVERMGQCNSNYIVDIYDVALEDKQAFV